MRDNTLWISESTFSQQYIELFSVIGSEGIYIDFATISTKVLGNQIG